METAQYLRNKLTEAGFTCRLNDLSCTVVLERPLDDSLIKRWQLACEEDIAHVVVMPRNTIALPSPRLPHLKLMKGFALKGICQPLPLDAMVCQHIAAYEIYASVCPHMIAHAGISKYMPAHASLRENMLAHASICGNMLAYARIC